MKAISEMLALVLRLSPLEHVKILIPRPCHQTPIQRALLRPRNLPVVTGFPDDSGADGPETHYNKHLRV